MILVPPEKVMLIGPSKVLTGSKVTLQCESSPSVPATILSWSVEQDGKTGKHYPSESVEQLEDGSFITRSELHLVAKHGHDLMVQCYGTNEVMKNDFKAFAHVIEILSKLKSFETYDCICFLQVPQEFQEYLEFHQIQKSKT